MPVSGGPPGVLNLELLPGAPVLGLFELFRFDMRLSDDLFPAQIVGADRLGKDFGRIGNDCAALRLEPALGAWLLQSAAQFSVQSIDDFFGCSGGYRDAHPRRVLIVGEAGFSQCRDISRGIDALGAGGRQSADFSTS